MVSETKPMRTIDRVQLSLKRRYAREKRFRALGLGAVVLGMSFVVLLFTSIVSKGYSAFVQTHIALDIRFDEQVIDPRGERQPEAMARADYAALVKAALREAFPGVSGRRELRELYSMVSSGAGFSLGDKVRADPSLIGTTQRLWLVADDDIDMLVKGRSTEIAVRSFAGIASPTGTSGQIKILTTANDFTAILDEVKANLAAVADRQERELRQKERAADDLGEQASRAEQRLAAAEAAGDQVLIERWRSALISARQQRTAAQDDAVRLREQIAGLRQRASAAGGEEALPPELPSYLVSINGGVVKEPGRVRFRPWPDGQQGFGGFGFGSGEIGVPVQPEQVGQVVVRGAALQVDLPAEHCSGITQGADGMAGIGLAVAPGARAVFPGLAPVDAAQPDQQIAAECGRPGGVRGDRGASFQAVVVTLIVIHASRDTRQFGAHQVGLGGVQVAARRVAAQRPAAGSLHFPGGQAQREFE